MSESFRTTPPDQPWSPSSNGGKGHQGGFGEPPSQDSDDAGEAGKILLVGVLGGLLSAAGYLIYRRLPEEQQQRIFRLLIFGPRLCRLGPHLPQ
jgi:hypothetical protein